MPEDNLIEIRISKVLHAEKWRVIRMLTRVEEFSKFVPSVKEAVILEKRHNVMKTRWRVQVDGVPVQWVEEDTLLLEQDTVYFKAIEGDLQEFRGHWRFSPHPEGTQVELNAYLRVDIPIIKDFAVAYMKKLLTANFESILEGVERRLVSLRYASYKSGETGNVAGFGIVGHLYNYVHLEKSLRELNPRFKMPSREFLSKLFHVTPSFKLYDIVGFKSKRGDTVNGCFIVATFIPDMIENDIWGVFSKVVKACKIAEKYGVGVVTLGGFASIVADKIGQEVANEVDVPVTSGNTFTVVMAIDAVLEAAELVGLDLGRAKVAVIGGAGDIGSACARALADKVKLIILSGRTKSKLAQVKSELAKMRKAHTVATTDNREAVKDADIVITAASSSASILPADWFKAGAIVCDVGYPKNVSYAPKGRNDILVFNGGLCRSPTPINLPLDIGLPSPDTIYGCFAEAILLALEKRFEKYSFGRGNITLEKIEEMRQLGEKHGFEISDFYWGDTLIEQSVFQKVEEIISLRE